MFGVRQRELDYGDPAINQQNFDMIQQHSNNIILDFEMNNQKKKKQRKYWWRFKIYVAFKQEKQ